MSNLIKLTNNPKDKNNSNKKTNPLLNSSLNNNEIIEIYPDSQDELKKIEKEQIEKQNNLLKLIKEAENQIKVEQKRGKDIYIQKELEINKRKFELQKLKENNNRLKYNLNKLQVETNKKLDKIEMKEKNEVFIKEKEKRQSSLDILLQVKEKEIVSSLQIIEQKKKEKNNLEKILEKNVDINQINNFYDKIKNAQKEIDDLQKEKEKLEKIQEEHYTCNKNQEKVIKEIENIKKELKIIQMTNRNKINEDRKNIFSNGNKNEEQKIKLKSRNNLNNLTINVNKSNELPLINKSNINKKENKIIDKELDKYEIEEYLKRFNDIKVEKKIFDKKYNIKKKEMNKEKDSLEKKCDAYNEQLKDDDNKNKLLINQIEEQKIEINELQKEMNTLLKRVEAKKQLFEEKEQQNQMFIQKIKDNKISI